MARKPKDEQTDNTVLSEAEIAELKAYKEKREREDREKVGITELYEDYEVPKGEEKDVHLLVGFISRPNPLDRSKDDLGMKMCHKLSEPAYRNFLDNIATVGCKIIKVLHLPEGIPSPSEYLEEKERKAEERKAEAKRVAANPKAALILNE